VLGYRYEDSPVIVNDGSSLPPSDYSAYIPSSHPGCVAPHAWLEDGKSLYDGFGSAFALLTKHDTDHPDVLRATEDARSAGVPLRIVKIPNSVSDELYPKAYTLVRPDQHVAWRGTEWLGPAVLAQVTGRRSAEILEVEA
jgi:hypothetical protein